eukprot:scaffold2006_cov77-Skeletonema_marinoi.AAC.5
MAVNRDTSGICQSSGTMYRLKLDVPLYKHEVGEYYLIELGTCNKSSLNQLRFVLCKGWDNF